MIQPLRARFAALPAPSITDELILEPATLGDYKRLAAFHYKSHHAGAVTSAFRLVHRAPSIAGRFLHRRDETQVVGVLLRSLPHLACRARDVATNFRYRGLGDHAASAAMLNREVRTISRVVIDPQWRGLGLAVKLVRHALTHGETIYTEALAAMGRVHPFFERAGMTRYDLPPRKEHARLLDALAAVGIEPVTLSSMRAMTAAMNALDNTQRLLLERELTRWFRTAARRSRCAHLRRETTIAEILAAARQQVMVQPVYYLSKREE